MWLRPLIDHTAVWSLYQYEDFHFHVANFLLTKSQISELRSIQPDIGIRVSEVSNIKTFCYMGAISNSEFISLEIVKRLHTDSIWNFLSNLQNTLNCRRFYMGGVCGLCQIWHNKSRAGRQKNIVKSMSNISFGS